MNLLPLTMQGWLEFCIIVCSLYWTLTKSAQRYGNRILLAALWYVLFCFGIYTTSCTLLIPLLPYITTLLCISVLIHKKNTIYAPIQAAKRDIILHETPNWLAEAIKIVLNHPNTTAPITILIEYKQSVASAIHNTTSLNITWNQVLFTSILYDPQIQHGMLWFTQNGLLKGLHVQWTSSEPINNNDLRTIHAQQTLLRDALVCSIDPASRTCIIIHHGAVHASKTFTETVQYITMLSHHNSPYTGERYHGNQQEQ